MTEEAGPVTKELTRTASEGRDPDFVAQIKSQLLEMPELSDDRVPFSGVTSTASRRLTSLRKTVVET